jgi:hypothetical protein
MAYVYYPGCETEEVPFYICDPCEEFENGRVRSVALITASYYPILMANPTSTAVWKSGILSEDIIIIPKVSGTLDAPEPLTGKGYGDDIESNLGRNFTLAWSDPNFKSNCNFYNTIAGKNGVYHVAYRTSSQTSVSTVPVTPDARSPITENIEDNVEWLGSAKWRSRLQPCPFDTPDDIFTCFGLED